MLSVSAAGAVARRDDRGDDDRRQRRAGNSESAPPDVDQKYAPPSAPRALAVLVRCRTLRPIVLAGAAG